MTRPLSTLRSLSDDAASAFTGAGIASARADAELLLGFVLGLSRGELQSAMILGSKVPTANEATRFNELIQRRAAREPLQHLTGTAPFRNVEMLVGPGVFIPRPETEQVAQVAIDAARAAVVKTGHVVVVDLCTGSGAIALAVALEVAESQVWAVELDAAAHQWALRNLEALGLKDRVTLVRGDARTALPDLTGLADVVVSNPPYVPSDAVPKDPEVANHDPAVALYGLGHDGLEVPRGIVAAAQRLLKPGGVFVMEHAEVQAEAARDLLANSSWRDVATFQDLTGRPRMVVGTIHNTASDDQRDQKS